MKVLLNDNYLAPKNQAPSDFSSLRDERPAWITAQQSGALPEITAFRVHFTLDADAKLRIHVTADERYILYLDGERIGRGPERGSDRAWFYETYDLDLTSGIHTVVALVWRLGEMAPGAQIGLDARFLLEAEAPYTTLLSTKSALWEMKSVDGLHFNFPENAKRLAYFVQPIQTTNASDYPWGIEHGKGEGWLPVTRRHEDFLFAYGLYPTHVLHAAMIPAQLDETNYGGRIRYVADAAWNEPQVVFVSPNANRPSEQEAWQLLLDESKPLSIPPHTQHQIIIDLEQYVCAYPRLLVSGGNGSCLTIGWAEALHLDASGTAKGQRDEIEGRNFIALGRDVFLPDGGEFRQFEPLWWRSGRFVQLLIQTGEQALKIDSFSIHETRYPLEMESRFSSSDKRLESISPIMLRSLQMCAHETYMDCPYYEQLMYVGDTRLEALTSYAISADVGLQRKAIYLFDLSRLSDGLTQARYPSRNVQMIPPFALWWIGMVYDYALWRGDDAFIISMLPGVRSVLDGFLKYVNSEDLLQAFAAWNFADWTAAWSLGVPPDGFSGISGIHNWHLVYTLGLAAKLEEWFGESLMAQRWLQWQEKIAKATKACFWNEERGLFADDLVHTSFSEHTQCLALLSGTLESEQYRRTATNLLEDLSLTKTTIYFTHYLFETYYLLRQPQAFFKRMELWFNLPEQGFKTTPEQPEPSRSDCHGWGSHPLYHYFATLLGIRPSTFGFEHLVIAPMPGHLTDLTGEMVHPSGLIKVNLHFEQDSVQGVLSLPDKLSGTFHYAGKTQALKQGTQQISL